VRLRFRSTAYLCVIQFAKPLSALQGGERRAPEAGGEVGGAANRMSGPLTLPSPPASGGRG